MTYEYLIKRLLPFSLGFLTAVFVTSLFQACGYLGSTAYVPEVTGISYSKPYTCKTKIRGGYSSGYGTGSGAGCPTTTPRAADIACGFMCGRVPRAAT